MLTTETLYLLTCCQQPPPSERATPSNSNRENVDIDLTTPFIEKVRSLNDIVSPLDYGGITNPYKHVNDTYGKGWSYDTGDTISGFTLLDMDNFDADRIGTGFI